MARSAALILVVFLVVAAVGGWWLRSRRRQPSGEVVRGASPGPVGEPGVAGPSPPPGLADPLARWVAAGLLTRPQAEAIVAYEGAAAAAAPTQRRTERRVPLVAEALGYLGAALAGSGLVMVVRHYWPDVATAGRLAIGSGGAVALFVAGALVHEQAAPALARLRGVLWLASTAATAAFAWMLAGEVLDVRRGTVLVAAGGAGALHAGLLWQGRERPLQQLAFLVGVAVTVGALVEDVSTTSVAGAAVWVTGATFVAVAVSGLGTTTELTALTGGLESCVGAVIFASQRQGLGLPLLAATALGLLALALVPALHVGRREQTVLGIVGAIALLWGGVPTAGYFAERGGVATGLVVWALGAGALLLAERRLVRVPTVVGVAAAAALIGGAALTGVQSPAFATLFGIGTAVALVALGARPDRFMQSLFGSLGLLINVPWAIAWWFPGTGRAPLMITVAGLLIIAVAVYLTRQGGRSGGGVGAPPTFGSPHRHRVVHH